MTALYELGVVELSAQLRAGKVSSLAAVQAALDRIARLEPRLHSYVTVMGDDALASARRADEEIAAGVDRGPLHGVPVAVKDIVGTADAPTTAGTSFLGDIWPRTDASVIERLRRGGAILLGKLTMTESALSEHHPVRPAPVNPWDAPLWTGVSSSGSGVAVAAGLCAAALGTDTGGSIRYPSAANGVTGLKPTWGRVSRRGLVPLCESLDHIGPMARSAADVAAILQVVAGHDPGDPTSLCAPVPDYLAALGDDLSELRLGVDADALTNEVDAEVCDAIFAAIAVLEGLGLRRRETRLPSARSMLELSSAIFGPEIALAHEPWFDAHKDSYGPVVRGVVEAGRQIPAVEAARAAVARAAFAGALRAMFEDVDILVLPVFPDPTRTVEEMTALAGDPAAFVLSHGRFALPFDMSGSPTLVLPCGRDRRGMPLALQLVGPHLSEAALLKVGHAFQTATDWARQRPPVD